MTILVTGATGSVGRLLVDELVKAGAPVRALTNNPAKAALPGGVEVVKGYLGRPATLPADSTTTQSASRTTSSTAWLT